jgi:hypothetical protein
MRKISIGKSETFELGDIAPVGDLAIIQLPNLPTKTTNGIELSPKQVGEVQRNIDTHIVKIIALPEKIKVKNENGEEKEHINPFLNGYKVGDSVVLEELSTSVIRKFDIVGLGNYSPNAAFLNLNMIVGKLK